MILQDYLPLGESQTLTARFGRDDLCSVHYELKALEKKEDFRMILSGHKNMLLELGSEDVHVPAYSKAALLKFFSVLDGKPSTESEMIQRVVKLSEDEVLLLADFLKNYYSIAK